MIEIYDTTLRDGTQGEGVDLTAADKLRIAALLDDFGVHLIEGGWPGSNPKDVEFFERARDLDLRHARLAAFGSTTRVGVAPEDDANLCTLVAADTPVCTIFGKTWKRHVENVLRTDADTNLGLIEDSVRFLVGADREVIYDAEHFFDGYNDDPDYAIACLRAAVAGGARVVVLCDTNGGMLPWRVDEVARDVIAKLDVPIGIHTHNDSGCAVANTLAAVRAGATHVQGTINGIGERCGNADLCASIANLELKLASPALPKGKLPHLTELARVVAEITNAAPPSSAPYVGRSAFAHKAGVHAAAVRRDHGSYEHVEPGVVGNSRRVLVSELAGRGNLVIKAGEYGVIDSDHLADGTLLAEIKELENQGFAFEAAEASVEMMMRRRGGDYTPFFELIDFMVVVEHREGRGLLAEANVKIRVGQQVFHTAADGAGPVGALDTALRKALTDVYPAVEQFRLSDYKVRILDGARATAALTRVLIDSTDGANIWTTVGASRNIIEASWQALFDSFEYGLCKALNGVSAAQGDATPAEIEAA